MSQDNRDCIEGKNFLSHVYLVYRSLLFYHSRQPWPKGKALGLSFRVPLRATPCNMPIFSSRQPYSLLPRQIFFRVSASFESLAPSAYLIVSQTMQNTESALSGFL